MTCRALAVAPLLILTQCVGNIDGPSGRAPFAGMGSEPGPPRPGGEPGPPRPGGGETGPKPPALPEEGLRTAADLGSTQLRRLTREEFQTVVRDALGVDTADLVRMAYPAESMTPFDNDATDQASGVRTLVQGIDTIANDTARRALADAAGRARLVPCQPTSVDDANCLRKFVTTAGARLLRRPVSDAEAETYVAQFLPFAKSGADFYVAVQLALRALLADPEFLYRIEVGTPVAGSTDITRLTDTEMATRMAFLLWGTAPNSALLAQLRSGSLSTRDGVKRVAETMLADSLAGAQIARFHGMWLGYHAEARLPAPLAASMRRESEMLVRRVVLADGRPWLDLFKMNETYVDAALAAHYKLPAPAAPGWVPYGNTGRLGILSHANFLAASSPRAGDTSPTHRGLFVRARLLCQTIPHPDPLSLQGNACKVNADCPPTSHCRQVDVNRKVCVVDVDAPPPGDGCKVDRYRQHAHGGCASCHVSMDTIGFGLERFAIDGSFRTHDENRPDCPLDGRGEVAGIGTFNGPGQLGALLAETTELETCAVRQLFRYVQARKEAPDDDGAIARLRTEFVAGRRSLRDLLIEMVSSEAFRHRVMPR